MDVALLETFVAIVEEGSFSAAGRRLLRTQPAISLALKRLETELGELLVDRSSKQLALTAAGRIVFEYAQRFDGLDRELRNALIEVRDKQSGRLTIGASESTALYLIEHVERYRQLFSGVKVEIRRSLSSRIPEAILAGSLDLGAISYVPMDSVLSALEIYTDSLTFIVAPEHRLAGRSEVSIKDLGTETFIAHSVSSPYRAAVIDIFQNHQVPLNMEVEMPTMETIRKFVQLNMGVAFLPRMCVEQEICNGVLTEVGVREIQVERKIRLVYPAKRQISYAAKALLDLVSRNKGD